MTQYHCLQKCMKEDTGKWYILGASSDCILPAFTHFLAKQKLEDDVPAISVVRYT